MDRIYIVGEMYGGRMQKKELQEMAAAPSGMFSRKCFICFASWWKTTTKIFQRLS